MVTISGLTSAGSNISFDDLTPIIKASGTPRTQRATLESVLQLLYPPSQIHWWGQGKVTAGAAGFTNFTANFQRLGTYSRMTTSVVNDEVEVKVVLLPGSYQLNILTINGPASGIFTVSFNGTQMGAAMDLYAAANVWNLIHTRAFTIDALSLNSFKFKTTGKNASASAFNIPITYVSFDRQ